MIIAIDGTTASGKGTVARGLAAHFGLPHLDTGLLYRAVGWQVALVGGNPDDAAQGLAACGFADRLLADPELRSEATGGLASRVSVHPQVRAALYQRQRSFALQPGGAVLDGRDIGTVIAPDADVKLYIDAPAAVRAARRHAELVAQGRDISFARVLADLAARDARDIARAAAPARAAPDALVLDTSKLAIDAAVAEAIRLVNAARPRLRILPWHPSRADVFDAINREWITAMFALEPADRAVIEHPEEAVIAPGGDILFVEAAGLGIIGTCALRRTASRAFELTKMGVRATARGEKAGEFLLAAAITRARQLQADPLYLLTNRRCAAAIHLYEKAGFVHDPAIMAEYGSLYTRCDVAMRFAD